MNAIDILSALEVLPVAYSEVIKLVRIAMTIPVTTAGNERFFSVLKRVKTYLRSTTSDERLSHLMLMSVERSLVKSLALDDLVDDCKIADASLSAAGVTDRQTCPLCRCWHA